MCLVEVSLKVYCFICFGLVVLSNRYLTVFNEYYIDVDMINREGKKKRCMSMK